MSKKTVCIDFDGVIHQYVSKFTTPDDIRDGMIPGAGRFLYSLLEEFDIAIFSTRSLRPEGMKAIYNWLDKNLDSELNEEEKKKVLDSIIIAHNKPRAIIYIDDRAWQFKGTFPDIQEIKNFKPWNAHLRNDGGT